MYQFKLKAGEAIGDFVVSCKSHSGHQMEGCRRVSSRVQAVYSGSRVYEQVWESPIYLRESLKSPKWLILKVAQPHHYNICGKLSARF